MKKAIFSLALAFVLLLGATPAYAAESPKSPTSDAINCPIQLFYHDPQTGLPEAVNFIEPDFETPPENYLYEITDRYTYEIHFQPPITEELTDTFKVDYSSDVKNGDLGTITIEYPDLVMTETSPTQTTYHGELKFVATGDLKLQHTAATVDSNNQLIIQLTTDGASYNQSNILPSFTATPIQITRSDTSQDLYATDLHSYLYPHTFAAFHGESPNIFNLHQRFFKTKP